jgi:hypothetical protein
MKLERSKQEHSVQAAMEAQEKSFGRITRSLSGETSAGLNGRDCCQQRSCRACSGSAYAFAVGL